MRDSRQVAHGEVHHELVGANRQLLAQRRVSLSPHKERRHQHRAAQPRLGHVRETSICPVVVDHGPERSRFESLPAIDIQDAVRELGPVRRHVQERVGDSLSLSAPQQPLGQSRNLEREDIPGPSNLRPAVQPSCEQGRVWAVDHNQACQRAAFGECGQPGDTAAPVMTDEQCLSRI